MAEASDQQYNGYGMFQSILDFINKFLEEEIMEFKEDFKGENVSDEELQLKPLPRKVKKQRSKRVILKLPELTVINEDSSESNCDASTLSTISKDDSLFQSLWDDVQITMKRSGVEIQTGTETEENNLVLSQSNHTESNAESDVSKSTSLHGAFDEQEEATKPGKDTAPAGTELKAEEETEIAQSTSSHETNDEQQEVRSTQSTSQDCKCEKATVLAQPDNGESKKATLDVADKEEDYNAKNVGNKVSNSKIRPTVSTYIAWGKKGSKKKRRSIRFFKWISRK